MGVCRWFVVNPTITVRLSEAELHKLDELAQRMGLTRSDVIRSLIARFDETLREEVEKEKKKWLAIGFTAALESAIIDPELVLRFVRRNVDILGFPDFLVGMVKVKNRVVLFSHHDRAGSQLLQLIRSRIEEEIRREEAEIEREGDEDEDTGGAGASKMPVVIRRGAHQRTPRAIPEVIKHKLVTSGRAAPPILRSIAVAATGKSAVSGGRDNAKAASNASVAEKQKSATLSPLAVDKSPTPQVEGSNPQAGADGSGKDVPNPVGQGANHGLSGDFIITLVTQSYHKHRDRLLKLIEDMMVR
jgi:hypothetical protein